jgi:hypothetical protein
VPITAQPARPFGEGITYLWIIHVNNILKILKHPENLSFLTHQPVNVRKNFGEKRILFDIQFFHVIL